MSRLLVTRKLGIDLVVSLVFVASTSVMTFVAVVLAVVVAVVVIEDLVVIGLDVKVTPCNSR